MGHDALELVSGELGDRPMRHHHHRLARCVAGNKGVDAGFLIHDIKLGNRHATGDGHFLDNIAQFALVGVTGIRIDGACAHHFGNSATAAGQVNPAQQRAEHDKANHGCGRQQPVARQQPVVKGEPGAFTTGHQVAHQANSQGNQRNGGQEQKHQQAGVAPGVGLALEKTGMSHG